MTRRRWSIAEDAAPPTNLAATHGSPEARANQADYDRMRAERQLAAARESLKQARDFVASLGKWPHGYFSTSQYWSATQAAVASEVKKLDDAFMDATLSGEPAPPPSGPLPEGVSSRPDLGGAQADGESGPTGSRPPEAAAVLDAMADHVWGMFAPRIRPGSVPPPDEDAPLWRDEMWKLVQLAARVPAGAPPEGRSDEVKAALIRRGNAMFVALKEAEWQEGRCVVCDGHETTGHERVSGGPAGRDSISEPCPVAFALSQDAYRYGEVVEPVVEQVLPDGSRFLFRLVPLNRLVGPSADGQTP